MKITSLFYIPLFFLASCTKNDKIASPSPPNQTLLPNPVPDTSLGTVYIAGSRGIHGYDTACYWRNGVAFPIQSGTNTISEATGIAVLGKDVYVVGTSSPNGQYEAAYWKNGIRVSLPGGTQYTTYSGIGVVGDDVYVAGYSGYGIEQALYWKNGIQFPLTDGSGDAQTSQLTVSGNDVYIAGFNTFGSHQVAMYWKNGNPVKLSDTTDSEVALGISVYGADVYVAGYVYKDTTTTARYWKNGVPVTLSTGSPNVIARTVAVLGQDVYVTGQSYKTVGGILTDVYYKNGNLVTPSETEPSGNAVVYGNQLYFYGHNPFTSDNYPGIYWQNGKPYSFSNGPDQSISHNLIIVPR